MEAGQRMYNAAAFLLELKARIQPTAIVETGTYLGTGSTVVFATLFPDIPILTIESNPVHHMHACNNLARFPNVQCYYGLSVARKDADDFIRQDSFLLLRPEGVVFEGNSPSESREFYSREIASRCQPDDMLKHIIARLPQPYRLLIFLDSAGGLGYLEYRQVRQLMVGRRFGLVLDDIQHVKHKRSWDDLANSSNVNILKVNPTDGYGWLVADVGVET